MSRERGRGALRSGTAAGFLTPKTADEPGGSSVTIYFRSELTAARPDETYPRPRMGQTRARGEGEMRAHRVFGGAGLCWLVFLGACPAEISCALSPRAIALHLDQDDQRRPLRAFSLRGSGPDPE
jgi:hypothetical protein